MSARGAGFLRAERGQAMTEFVIVLPLLVVLLFGVIQFGIVFHNYVTLVDAARVGARKGAVSRYLPDPTGATKAAVRASASDLDQSKLEVEVTPSPGWEKGADIVVEAKYPYEIELLDWAIGSGTLTTKTTERVE